MQPTVKVKQLYNKVLLCACKFVSIFVGIQHYSSAGKVFLSPLFRWCAPTFLAVVMKYL